VSCDACGDSRRVKDEAIGKRFKCQGCGKVLTVTSAESDSDQYDLTGIDVSAEAAIDQDDESVPRRARSKSGGSKPRPKSRTIRLSDTRVLTGLQCVFFGFLIFVAILVWIAVGSFLSPRQLVASMRVISLIGFGATLLTVTGKLLCLTAPPQMPGKEFLFVAAGIDVLSLLLTIIRMTASLPPVLSQIVSLLNMPMTAIGFLTFVLFLKNLGKFTQESDVVERADGTLLMGFLFTGTWLTIACLPFAARGAAMGVMVLVLGLPLLVLGVLTAIRYFGLLNASRYAVLEAN